MRLGMKKYKSVRISYKIKQTHIESQIKHLICINQKLSARSQILLNHIVAFNTSQHCKMDNMGVEKLTIFYRRERRHLRVIRFRPLNQTWWNTKIIHTGDTVMIFDITGWSPYESKRMPHNPRGESTWLEIWIPRKRIERHKLRNKLCWADGLTGLGWMEQANKTGKIRIIFGAFTSMH